jgi:hypothetical protein
MYLEGILFHIGGDVDINVDCVTDMFEQQTDISIICLPIEPEATVGMKLIS